MQRTNLTLASAILVALALGAFSCARTVVPSDGSGTDSPQSTDVSRDGDRIDTGPMRCEIVGRYRTNGGLIMTLTLAADGTYSADGGRFVGRYAWNGSSLAFTPGPGSTSNECASRAGSTVMVSFDGACRQALVVVTLDGCTGSGLLTTTSNLTRL